MVITHDQCFYLGYISKVQGFKGGMIAFLDVDNANDYAKLQRVLVDMHGVLTPFFIQSVTIKDKSFAHITIEGVKNRDQAVELSGKDLYLPLSDLPNLGEDQYYLHELVGMEVIDKVHGSLGIVEKVMDYSQNTLLQILKENNEILIPLNDQFVERVAKKDKQIFVSVPDGLLEINKA